MALFDSDWFPTPKRLIELCHDCLTERLKRERLTAAPAPSHDRPLVCPFCHGARWISLGGASPIKTKPGPLTGERIQSCKHCTTDSRHDIHKETITVGKHGGVPDPNADRQPQMDAQHNTWRAPRDENGRIDIEELYRQSRILRELDPTVDERPREVSGFHSIGSLIGRTTRKEDPLAF